MPNTPDKILWRRFASVGDQEAIGILYEKYEKALLILIYKWTQDLDKARDVLQEAFCKLLVERDTKAEQFKNIEMDNFLNWMTKYARFVYLPNNRSETARKNREFSFGSHSADKHPLAPRFDRADILAAIHLVSKPSYREILNKVLNGKTNGEIAYEMDLTKEQVAQYFFKARKELREFLKH